jgi:hypothetical protein
MTQALPVLALFDEYLSEQSLVPQQVYSIPTTDVVGAYLSPLGSSRGTFKYNIDNTGWVQVPMGGCTEMLTPTTSLWLVCDIVSVVKIRTFKQETNARAGGFAVGGLGGNSGGGSGPGVQPTVVVLSTDYVLQATDDGKIFVGTTGLTLTMTVPVGLAWVTGVIIKPAATGSITLHPTGGAMVNGSTSDVAINILTNPVPAALVASAITDNYGLTVAGSGWSTLTGVPSDSPAWVTAMAGYALMPPGGAKLSSAYTVADSDRGSMLWLSAQTADKAISVPSTLANNFWCIVAYQNLTAATGRLKLQSSGGSTLNGTLNINTGALAQGPFFLGTAGANNIAAALVMSEGSTPGGTFLVMPLCGVFASS